MNNVFKEGLSGFWLKIIAIVTMTIDHIGAVFFPQIVIFRIIGRLAFPIFAFLLSEGFYYTKNVKKYGMRLFLFAFLSEVPFDLVFYHTQVYFKHQNIFFTLFLSLVMVYYMNQTSKEFFKGIIFILTAGCAWLFHVDYGIGGILFVLIFQYLRNDNRMKFMVFACADLLCFPVAGTQVAAIGAIIPLSLYNNKKGPDLKYLFYWYYPVHLLVIYMVKRMIG